MKLFHGIIRDSAVLVRAPSLQRAAEIVADEFQYAPGYPQNTEPLLTEVAADGEEGVVKDWVLTTWKDDDE